MIIRAFKPALAIAAVLAACAPVNGPETRSLYDCANGTQLKVEKLSGSRVLVQMNDDAPLTLPPEPAASGARYMTATHQFWDKGAEAMWTVGRMAPMTCARVMFPGNM
ncbi:MliC family protein [Erythrobacter sp. R86502]|uniref:MliC family protein n=1 Tax=Erythrobacter sp. R86502 TaxID=3093846 RepID=UPI0036D2F732